MGQVSVLLLAGLSPRSLAREPCGGRGPLRTVALRKGSLWHSVRTLGPLRRLAARRRPPVRGLVAGTHRRARASSKEHGPQCCRPRCEEGTYEKGGVGAAGQSGELALARRQQRV